MFLIWSNNAFKTIFLFSSIYIKGAKAKLSIFVKLCIKKAKRKKENKRN